MKVPYFIYFSNNTNPCRDTLLHDLVISCDDIFIASVTGLVSDDAIVDIKLAIGKPGWP